MNNNIEINLLGSNDNFQVLDINITGNGQATPENLKLTELPEGINFSKGVIVNGKAPIWLYSHVVHLLHISKWVAVFDPRLGAVIVQTHSVEPPELGDIIPYSEIEEFILNKNNQKLSNQKEKSSKSKVIAIVGPPNSGKTVFTNYLLRVIKEKIGTEHFMNDIYKIHANPDGEGDWTTEIDEERRKALRNKKMFDAEFTQKMLRDIENTKNVKKIIFIDCGGRIDKKNNLILSKCTHAIIVSSNNEDTNKWLGAIELSELKTLAEITSVTEYCSEQTGQKTFKIGKLFRGEKDIEIPENIFHAILEGVYTQF